MKMVYYDGPDKKLFEISLDRLDYIPDYDLIDDDFHLNTYYKKLLSRFSEEVLVFIPIDDGNDFYLKYFNHVNYFDEEDYNFRIGARVSQTFARNDDGNNLLNMFKEIYNTGIERKGIVKYLTKDGKLFKSLDFNYFMLDGKLTIIHEDKTEIRMYREITLNNKELGVAIYQNKRFVEVNDKYAKTVSKTKEELLGSAQDLRGVPKEMVDVILKEVTAIENQEQRSYKTPMVSYDENGDIRYYINAEGSYIVYDNMPAVLFKIKDLTLQERAKRLNATNADENTRIKSAISELGEYSKLFLSYGIFPDKYIISESFYDVIEDDNRDYVFTKAALKDFIVGDDLNIYYDMINSLSPANPEVEFTTTVMTLKFNIKYVRHSIKVLYDDDGNLRAYVSAHQDITDDVLYSNSLKEQIYEKNEIIKNKNVQLKEAHHTIKNNLNILLSLIRIEELHNKKAEDIVEETKSHIKAISVMHENLYKSKNLKDIPLKNYIDSIVESLFEIYSTDIKYTSLVDDISLNADQAGNLGLIINELINNTVKHAFPSNNNGKIEIKLSRFDKVFEVEYRDSGIGLPDNIDFENPTSMGLILVKNLSEQIDGEIKYFYDNGACFKLEFKETESF